MASKYWQLLRIEVCRAVTSDIINPQSESRHEQNFIFQLYNRKGKNKEKEAGNGPSLKKEKCFHWA